MRKTFLVKYCLISCLISSNFFAQDCAPESLHAFALTHKLKSVKTEWFNVCKPDDVGSDLRVVIEGWHKLLPNNPLIVVYSADAMLDEPSLNLSAPSVITLRILRQDLKSLTRKDITPRTDVAYLWVGVCQSGWHMALISFLEENKVRMVHPNTIDTVFGGPYIETLEMDDFFQRTYVIFCLED